MARVGVADPESSTWVEAAKCSWVGSGRRLCVFRESSWSTLQRKTQQDHKLANTKAHVVVVNTAAKSRKKRRSSSTLQRKAAKSARRSQHCSETTLQRRPSKSARPEGVRRKFQWTLFRFPFGPVLRIFSRQSRALCTLSVCTTCSLITFPQAVCPKRETLLTQERLCPAEALGY